MEQASWSLFLVALLAERLVEIAKHMIIPLIGNKSSDQKDLLWKGIGLSMGVLLAFGMHVNFFEILKVSGAPLLGQLLAGLFAGMGTQWVHELVSNLPYYAVRCYRGQVQLQKDRTSEEQKQKQQP